MTNKKINKIVVKYMVDEDPDLSWLQQDYNNVTDEENEKYKEQDRQRLEAYDQGQWYMMGIKAEAEISIRQGNSWLIQYIDSGGIWGIETDSDEDYIQEVANEQIADLKDVLKNTFKFTDKQIDNAPIVDKRD